MTLRRVAMWLALPFAVVWLSVGTFNAHGTIGSVRVNPAPSAVESGSPGRESVLQELIRLQREQGLTIAWYEHDLNAVRFDRRSTGVENRLPGLSDHMAGAVSGDGILVAGYFGLAGMRLDLGIVRSDGNDPAEYPGLLPADFCWSHDNRWLALTDGHPSASRLLVMNIETKATETIVVSNDDRAHLTSQCWSPDDKAIVFENHGSARIYDRERKEVTELTQGEDATWSPDGQWIAVRQRNTYFAVRPTGDEKKQLFHRKDATSAMFWSPDSGMVAYVTLAGILEGGFSLDAEVYRLRVRRLEDNSEDWVAQGVSCCIAYQWIKSKDFLALFKGSFGK